MILANGIDILSKVLKLPENLQNDANQWYEFYTSNYQFLSNKNHILELINIINDTVYKVYCDIPTKAFKTDALILGNIVS